MRQSNNQRRGRGRNNQNRRPNRNQSFDSNGPGVRLRGTAAQLYEKYQALARDATSAGDRVMLENYHQHADHYYRVMVAQNPQTEQNEDRPSTTGDTTDQPQNQRGRGNRNRRGRQHDSGEKGGQDADAKKADGTQDDRPSEAQDQEQRSGRRQQQRRQDGPALKDTDPRKRAAGGPAGEAKPGNEPLDQGLHRMLGGAPGEEDAAAAAGDAKAPESAQEPKDAAKPARGRRKPAAADKDTSADDKSDGGKKDDAVVDAAE